MVLEDFFVSPPDAQFDLRSEKALQTTDPAQFLDLFGDPRFEAPIKLRYLIGALAQFLEQPRVLDRDHRLAGKVVTSSICLGVNSTGSGRRSRMAPIAAPSQSSGDAEDRSTAKP